MSVNLQGGGYLNPQEVIESGLPDIIIPSSTETVRSSSLTEQFIGHIAKWSDFKDEVTKFYRNKDLQRAFQDFQGTKADIDTSSVQAESPHFAGLEHTQIGEERDLHGRFLENVINRVLSTLKIIMEPKHVKWEHITELQKLPLTNNINIGSAKTVPEPIRKQHEPDIVFKIPGSGAQTVRIVRELKFPTTCFLSEAYADTDLYATGGLRHILGQVARDMREHGTRFGFVSTYNETVFVKITRGKEGKYSLHYSEVVPHTQSLLDDDPHGPLSAVSVRFVMLWLIYRASHKDGCWAFQPSDIPKATWTRTGRRAAGPGKLIESYKTPFKAAAQKLEKHAQKAMNRMHITPRPREKTAGDTTPDTPMTPTPAGVTPDDPHDLDYVPSDEDTPYPSSGLSAQVDRLMADLEDDDDPQAEPSVRGFALIGEQLRQARHGDDAEDPD